MNDLKALVKRLEETCDEEDQIQRLQEIGKELVSNYVIRLSDNIEIQPLWVEAYYSDIDSMEVYESNIGKKFMDPFIHGANEQKGAENFGKLYFHHKTDDLRSGVDICLSCGPYYLSFLLKYTLVNGVFTTQSQLSGKIREMYNNLGKEKQTRILNRVENATKYVTYTARIGLDATKEKGPVKREQKELYQPMLLAIVRDFHKTFPATLSLPKKKFWRSNIWITPI